MFVSASGRAQGRRRRVRDAHTRTISILYHPLRSPSLSHAPTTPAPTRPRTPPAHTPANTTRAHTKKTSSGAGSTSRGPACPALRRRSRTGSSSTRATRSRCGAPTARSMTTPSKCVRHARSPALTFVDFLHSFVRWFARLLLVQCVPAIFPVVVVCQGLLLARWLGVASSCLPLRSAVVSTLCLSYMYTCRKEWGGLVRDYYQARCVNT